MQERYDTETSYSRNFEEQARWQKLVNAELEMLSKFKSKK